MGAKVKKRDRVICWWCHGSVPVRNDLSLFKHKYAGKVCTGSGNGLVAQGIRYWQVREAWEAMQAMRNRSV